MTSTDNHEEMPETGQDLSVTRTQAFANWLVARQKAKENEEPIDKQMRLLRINTFLTLAILVGVGGADYNSELLSILWFI